MKEALRGAALATFLITGGIVGLACGGDDSSSGGTSTSGGTSGTTSGGTSGTTSGGTSSGTSGTTSGGTSSGTSGTPDSGTPDTAVAPAAATPTFTPAPGPYKTVQNVTISDTTPNATIYFTVDGTNPTTGSQVYANPVAIATTTTIRAMAAAPGFQNSVVGVGVYTITPDVGVTAPVVLVPPAGENNNPIAVGLSTATQPSTICYTVDGSAPTCTAGVCTGTSATYSAGSPIPVDAPTGGGGATVKALACSAGNANSDVTTQVYTFRAAAVTATPGSEEIPYLGNVTFSTATITTGGNPVAIRFNQTSTGAVLADPTCVISDRNIAASAGAVTVQQDTDYRAIACRQNYLPSAPTTFNYTVRQTTPGWALGHDPTNVTNYPANGGGGVPFINDNSIDGANGGAPNTINPAAGATVGGGTVDSPAAPATGKLCYRLGGPAGCDGRTGNCDTNSVPGAPTANGNNNGTASVVSCRANYTGATPLPGTFTFRAAPIVITTGPGGSGAAPATGDSAALATTGPGNYWDNGNAHNFVITTLTTGLAATHTHVAWSVDGTTPTCDAAWATVVGKTGRSADGASSTTTDLLTPSAFPVGTFPTVQAIACKDNYTDSPIRSMAFSDPTQKVNITSLTPADGTYAENFTVVTTTDHDTPGPATVCYNTTTNGIDPAAPVCDPSKAAGTECVLPATSTPPAVTQDNTRVWAQACKTGVPKASDLSKRTYFLKVGIPTFSALVNGGPSAAVANGGSATIEYGSAISLNTVTCNSGVIGVPGLGCATPPTFQGAPAPAPVPDQVTFHYTFGSPVAPDPTCATAVPAPIGAPPFSFNFDNAHGAQSAQIKVIGCRTNFQHSDISAATFSATLAPPDLTNTGTCPSVGSPPSTFCPNGPYTNSVGEGFSSASSTAPGFRICYTIDNGIPACNPAGVCAAGSQVAPALPATQNINIDNTNVRAVACATGYPASGETDANIRLKVAPPLVTPAAGPQGGAVNITVATQETSSSRMCYSVDGTPAPLDCSGPTDAGIPGPNATPPRTPGLHCSTALPTVLNASTTYLTFSNVGTSFRLRARICRNNPAGGSFQPSDEIDQTYTFGAYTRTITLDDDFNDWVAGQNLVTSVGGSDFYVAWDTTYVYLGFNGSDLASSANRYFNWYVKAATGATTTTQDDIIVGGNTSFGTATLPIAFSHNYYFRTNGTLFGVRSWDGAQWQDAAGLTFERQLGTGGAGAPFPGVAAIEIRFPRADLGLTGAASTITMAPRIHDQGNPATLIRAFPSGSTAAETTYYSADMNSANVPAFAGYSIP